MMGGHGRLTPVTFYEARNTRENFVATYFNQVSTRKLGETNNSDIYQSYVHTPKGVASERVAL